MCTLIALHACHPEVPLAVAANRDEWLARPSAGFAVRRTAGRVILAPSDLRAGGTWLGLNDAGVFVGLTNRPGSLDESRRSRGLLVLSLLGAGSAAEAAEQLGRLPDAAYNGFNLFVADRKDAAVAVYEDTVAITECAPGVHVVGNADPNDRAVPKVRRNLEAATRVAEGPPDEWLDRLSTICCAHEGEPPYGATCVHADGYGTRSSTLLRLGGDGRGELRHAAGAPCETEYKDLSAFLGALRIDADEPEARMAEIR
jgi:uncharacterized protein with NRDE domain